MPSAEKNKWKVFLLVATSIFMSTLDSSIVNVALPYMMQSLHTDIETIQWVVLIYLITVSSLLLTFGRLSDIHGKKVVYTLGFAVFVAGSWLCGLSGSAAMLVFSRTIQGFGAAMLMACSPALVVDAFPAEERGKALGMIGAVVAAGLTTGPVLGGLILEYFSWQFIFYINIPIGLAATVGGLLLLRQPVFSKGSREPLDKIGSLLLIVAVSCLIVLMTQVSKWGLISLPSGGMALLCITASVWLVINEYQARYPLFDMALLKIRLFIYPVISSSILFAGLFIIMFIMPFYLTYPCGFSASKTGGIMIVPFLFLLFVSPVAGMMYDRLGSRRLCMVGMGALALSQALLIYVEPSMGVWPVVWRIGLAGLGTALFVSPNNTAVMSSVPLSRRGIASGAVATSRNLGMVIGVALAGLVFSTSFSGLAGGAALEHYTGDMESYFMISFKRTMIMGSVLSVFGMGITFARGREEA